MVDSASYIDWGFIGVRHGEIIFGFVRSIVLCLVFAEIVIKGHNIESITTIH